MMRSAAVRAILVATLFTVALGVFLVPRWPALGARGGAVASAPAAESDAAPVEILAVVPAKPVQVNAFPPPATFGGRDWLYFPETGHYVSGGFKTYFERNGGLAVFGYPVTEELVEDGWTVQYFQRARLELHPSPAEPVQRALLGDLLRSTAPPAGDPQSRSRWLPEAGAPPGGRFYPETGFSVTPPVLAYFDRQGGVATFGYPTSRAEGGVQWFQRGRLEWHGDLVQAALIGDEYTDSIGLAHARERAQPPQIARIDAPAASAYLPVFATPGGTTHVTRLPQDAQVTVTGEVRAPNGDVWYAVRIWNALDGYVPVEALAFTPAPAKSAGGGGTPWQPAPPAAQGPFAVAFDATTRAPAGVAASPADQPAGQLAAGERLRVTAWATDTRGQPWYAVQAPGVSGWLPSQAVTAVTRDPLTATVHGRSLASTVAGKGMWFTYDVLRHTPIEHVIAAAQANGFSFLAPQVGTSRRGYWAGPELDTLLDAAHAAGLKVIPWIYPWLVDVPSDVELAVRAAQHVSPSGRHVDGLGVDIEENLDEAAVRAFGQVLRARVGDDTLLVAITFQPQNAPGQRTPFATIAESFNVIAPMSYWHLRNVPHTYQDAYQYVAESVRLIRARVGRSDVPIAVIGQTFDWFTRNEVGPGNPTADEIRGAMQAARDTGALGTGFFNWFHTTPEEWEAIATFPW